MLEYFTRTLSGAELFGSYAWFYFVLQILAAALGAYLIWLHTERNPVWRVLYRRVGIAMLALGLLGTLLGSLRLAAVAPFTMRLWFYMLLLIQLGGIGYLVYYVRSVMPERIREARSRPLNVSRQAAAAPSEPKPEPTTSRREARRDRKRKGR